MMRCAPLISIVAQSVPMELILPPNDAPQQTGAVQVIQVRTPSDSEHLYRLIPSSRSECATENLLPPPTGQPTGNQCGDFIKHFPAEPIGSPLVRVLFTKGMIAADFLGDPTGTGLDMPSQTHRELAGAGRLWTRCAARRRSRSSPSRSPADRRRSGDPAGALDDIRTGPCVTSIAGPNGDAQLYER
jgi:hypothetical protein